MNKTSKISIWWQEPYWRIEDEVFLIGEISNAAKYLEIFQIFLLFIRLHR